MVKDKILDRIVSLISGQSILIMLVMLIVLFSILTPSRFLSSENIGNVSRQISFDAIIALGMLVVLLTGGIDLSVGSVLSLAAALTMGLQPHGVGVAVAAAIVMGLAVGAFNGLMVTKGRVMPFIVTLGSMQIVYGIMLTYTHQEPISGTVAWFSVFGNGNLGPLPIPLLIMLVMLLIFHVGLVYTRFGRSLYAVGGNEEATRLAGIDANRVRFAAYVISGFCAALAGVLLASRLNASTIHIGLQTPLYVVAACIMGGASILGGRGSAVGACLGILALGILGNGMGMLGIPTFTQLAIRALILIAVVAIDAFYATTIRQRLQRSSAIGAYKAKGTTQAGKAPP